MIEEEVQQCDLFQNNTQNCVILKITKNVSSVLSIFGCVIIMLIIVIFRRYRSFTQRLVMYMTLTALANGIVFLISYSTIPSFQCTMAGIMMLYTSWVLLLLVCFMVINIYINIIHERATYDLERIYILICFVTPVIICCLPLVKFDNYGPSGDWCCLADFWWRIGVWYAPAGFVILCMFSLYLYVNYRVYRVATSWQGLYANNTEDKIIYERDIKPLRFYPLIELIPYVIGLITRIHSLIQPNNPSFILYFLMAVSYPLRGTFYAIVYGLDSETRAMLTYYELQHSIRSYCYRNKVKEVVPHIIT